MLDPYLKANLKFCPRCRASLELKHESAYCPACQFEYYQNPAPAMAVFIEKDNQILLGRRKREPLAGWWDAVGGFAMSKETLEQACHREVMEETGLTIKLGQYLGSEPDRYQGLPTVTVGFTAQIMKGEMQAQDDVAALKWFKKDQIPDKIAFKSVQILLTNYLSKG